jgi:hypothetical protein
MSQYTPGTNKKLLKNKVLKGKTLPICEIAAALTQSVHVPVNI